MPKVIVISQAGEEVTVEAPSGESLMVALRDHGHGVVEEGFGLCGGCCSCYTCHLWIDDPSFTSLSAPSTQEDDLLALASHRRPNSRLGCQIALSAALDGLRVTVPPAD